MGSTSYDANDWAAYSKKASTQTVSQNFNACKLHDSLNPKLFKLREARDSATHPVTTPIFVNLDVTGSMGFLAQYIAVKGIGLVFEELLSRQPVKGPQLAFGGIGDIYDIAPSQVSQFESASKELTDSLQNLWLEGHGGGNGSEGYNIPWYVALTRISHDAYEKRKKRGYLFTIGDEGVPPSLTPDQIKTVFGDTVERVPTNSELLEAISNEWHVFHIMITESLTFRSYKQEFTEQWTKLLGERALPLSDHNNLAELIVSTIQICEGTAIEEVVNSWSGSTALVIKQATDRLGNQIATINDSKGLVRF